MAFRDVSDFAGCTRLSEELRVGPRAEVADVPEVVAAEPATAETTEAVEDAAVTEEAKVVVDEVRALLIICSRR